MKEKEKEQAIALRKKGLSYADILKHINVSKSTLSLWLRNIPLTEKQQHALYVTRRQKHIYNLAKLKRHKKQQALLKIQKQAEIDMPRLISNPFFLTGLMLYWAEGDKSAKAELVKFSNADPAIIKIMMQWFTSICQVPKSRFRIALHIHSLHTNKKVLAYWSNITNIPLTQFHKTQIKPTSLSHRKNKLYNGTCSIRIHDKTLFRQIQAWLRTYKKYIDTKPFL